MRTLSLIKFAFAQRLRQRADDFVLRDLVEEQFAFIKLAHPIASKQPEKTWQRTNKTQFLVKQNDAENPEYASILKDNKIQALSDEEKVQLLKGPQFWLKTYYLCGPDSRSLYYQGFRSLWGNAHGFTPEIFRQQIDQVRKTTGHPTPLVLDLGGAVGLALNQAKEADPNILTYNITIDEEPAMLSTDHTLICPAEAILQELEGKVDFLFSRTAFRYFAYPDIALKNSIKMLAPGGHADIAFNTKRSIIYENKEEIDGRLAETFGKIKDLEEAGEIKTNLTDKDYESVNRNSVFQIEIDRI